MSSVKNEFSKITLAKQSKTGLGNPGTGNETCKLNFDEHNLLTKIQICLFDTSDESGHLKKSLTAFTNR